LHTLATILVLLVALEHVWILILEMFLWTKPLGLKTFRQSREAAEATRVLAANQGSTTVSSPPGCSGAWPGATMRCKSSS
jgi:uncharacterized membrane protein